MCAQRLLVRGKQAEISQGQRAISRLVCRSVSSLGACHLKPAPGCFGPSSVAARTPVTHSAIHRAVEGCLFLLFFPLCSRLLLLPPVVLPHVPLRWHFVCHLHFSCRPRGLEEIREVKQCDFTKGAHDLVHLSFQCFPFCLGPLLVISSYIKCVAIWSKGHVCHVHFVCKDSSTSV